MIEIENDGISDAIAKGSSLARFGSGYRHTNIVVVPLAAIDTGGGIFAWQNPENGSILITKVVLDVTTPASAACAADVGTTATNATTLSDNLIDGVDVHTAAGVFSQADGADANGKAQQKLASGKWVTGSKASGASAGLQGNIYIHYVNI